MGVVLRQSRRRGKTRTVDREQVWILVGQRRGRIWLAHRMGYGMGSVARVEFDGLRALRREERRHDVVGFLHTHPHGAARPSVRDLRTMRAWCSAFGKPLLCVIVGQSTAAFRFDDGQAEPVELAAIEEFPRGILVGVEDHGRKAAS